MVRFIGANLSGFCSKPAHTSRIFYCCKHNLFLSGSSKLRICKICYNTYKHFALKFLQYFKAKYSVYMVYNF